MGQACVMYEFVSKRVETGFYVRGMRHALRPTPIKKGLDRMLENATIRLQLKPVKPHISITPPKPAILNS